MSFLPEKYKHELDVMAQLVSRPYFNSRGTKVFGKALLVGENMCTLDGVKLRKAETGNFYIEIEFSREDAEVYGYNNKVKFAPHREIIFDYERANELCVAFGHELKPKPEDMQMNDYLTHVARRIRTFVGRVVKIYVTYFKVVRTDDFGVTEQRNKLVGMKDLVHEYEKEDIEDVRLKTMFCNINEQKDLDMWEMRCNFVE